MKTSQDIIAEVRKIEIKTKRLTNHIFGGEYHSSFKGRGMSFAEVREYQYGDDVRTIDWNVSARLKKPFVKIFEEERELTLMLLIDVSASELFGTKKQTKKDLITQLSAVLSFSASANNDKVGVILFSDQIELYIPPKKGRSHILRIIKELVDFHPKSKGTNIQVALNYLSNIQKKRSIAFLLSDFKSNDYQEALNLACKRHDLTAIKVADKFDKTLPNIGLVQLQDPETGIKKWVDTSNKKVQALFKSNYYSEQVYFQESCLKAGAGKIEIDTDESYVKKLMLYFKARA